MKKEGDIMLTKKQVMEQLNISLSTIDRLIRGGKLPSHKMGKAVRIKQSDVERYIEETRQH